MKPFKILKLIAVISYLFIFLSGDMVALPLCLWLLFSIIGGTIQEQLMAAFAIIAVIVNFITLNNRPGIKTILLDVLCFVLMVIPVIARLLVVPLAKFNYSSFTIPFCIFIGCFAMSICISIKVCYGRNIVTSNKTT